MSTCTRGSITNCLRDLPVDGIGDVPILPGEDKRLLQQKISGTAGNIRKYHPNFRVKTWQGKTVIHILRVS